MCDCPMPMPIGPKGICERCWTEGPFHQQALREADAAGRDVQHQGDDLSKYEFTDWHKAWDEEPTEIQWLLAPLLERGTANVIYSDAGVGKSLVALESAAGIAQTEHVLYVDSENRRRDHRDRLQAMGYTPEKLANLHMLSFPELPPIDKREGGDVLLRLAKKVSAALVVIDTTMRFVDGGENDADTFNSMYKYTMLPLKGAGICSLRLDHEGKDSSKGQRGSSGKRGDVDSVWRLTHPQKGPNRWLENEKDRSHHYPDKIRLELTFNPFGHAFRWNDNYLDAGPQPQENTAVTILKEAGVTAKMTVRQARERVTAAGKGMRQDTLMQALREIKDVTPDDGNSG